MTFDLLRLLFGTVEVDGMDLRGSNWRVSFSNRKRAERWVWNFLPPGVSVPGYTCPAEFGAWVAADSPWLNGSEAIVLKETVSTLSRTQRRKEFRQAPSCESLQTWTPEIIHADIFDVARQDM